MRVTKISPIHPLFIKRTSQLSSSLLFPPKAFPSNHNHVSANVAARLLSISYVNTREKNYLTSDLRTVNSSDYLRYIDSTRLDGVYYQKRRHGATC